MTPIVATYATVRAVREHKVTTSARKDPLDPQMTITQHVSLGWFIHVDFGPESGPISIGVGNELPRDVKIGDEIIVAIFKSDRK